MLIFDQYFQILLNFYEWPRWITTIRLLLILKAIVANFWDNGIKPNININLENNEYMLISNQYFGILLN